MKEKKLFILSTFIISAIIIGIISMGYDVSNILQTHVGTSLP